MYATKKPLRTGHASRKQVSRAISMHPKSRKLALTIFMASNCHEHALGAFQPSG